MDPSLFAWLGMPQELTARQMVEGAEGLEHSVSHPLTVGLIMETSIKPAGYFGPLNKSTAKKFPGLTCLFSLVMSHLNPWDSKPLDLVEVEKTFGRRKMIFIGERKERGLMTSVIQVSVSWKTRLLLFK